MENLVVGQRVTLNRAMMAEPVGSVGYVYEVYQDFTHPDLNGVSIIFMNGSYDGFSREDQERHLVVGDVDQRYSMYNFENSVNKVWRDYKNGYWKFF